MKPYIESIITYMEAHASDGIKIEEVAAEFGYSKFHFSREFKKITGISPNQYLASLKLTSGIESILEGQSITDSQMEAGYSSSGTFSTTFLKNTGLSPRTYSQKINELFDTAKQHEIVNEDSDSLFYRNPLYPTVLAPYKLTVTIEVPESFKGLVFSGLFLSPNPNHQPVMGRCRVKEFTYLFYHLPAGTYFPLACGIKKSLNPFSYFQLKKAMRACDGQKITFPLKKDEELTLKLRESQVSDPPLVINLPNILSVGIKQQIKRNKKKLTNN